MKKFKTFLPHLCISMLLVLIPIVILDSFNPTIGFLNSTVSKVYLLLLCAVGLVVCIDLVSRNRKP